MNPDFNTLSNLLTCHSGLVSSKAYPALLRSAQIQVNRDTPPSPDQLIKAEDIVTLAETDYRAVEGGQGRLQLIGPEAPEPAHLSQPVRVHCGLHKCLTMYQRKVYTSSMRLSSALGFNYVSNSSAKPPPFQHFYHRRDAFYGNYHRHRLSSLSGQSLNLDKFEDLRVVRVIRDPRDLLISGYFYHLQAAEHWCNLKGSTALDWTIVNGQVPESLPAEMTFSEYLHSVSKEEGLLAEIDFRRHHYDSLLSWPEDDPRIKLFKYDDILGREVEAFQEMFEFLNLSWSATKAARHYAARYRAGKKSANTSHIRNPNSGQWRKHFTPAVTEKFEALYTPLLERYHYSP